jgi:spermidine synthase
VLHNDVQMYTLEFYQLASRKLKPNGCLVTQAGCSSAWLKDALETGDTTQFSSIANTLKQVFGHRVYSYGAYLPSFTDEWGFHVCYKKDFSPDNLIDIIGGQGVDEAIHTLGLEDKLEWYDTTSHRKMFALPKYVRKILEKDSTINTLAKPFYLTKTEACQVKGVYNATKDKDTN